MWESLAALLTVVTIDIALAGDNAVVVGMAAAGLEPHLRRRAIVIGIVAAAALRIVFAAFTIQLLQIVGLTLAGGLLLLLVAWKLWREIKFGDKELSGAEGAAPDKTMRQAVTQIVLADVSMSLDNVLAVAGAARQHMAVMVVGLALSVGLMGFAANLIAGLLQRHRWLTHFGLLMIVGVALRMIWEGAHEVIALAG